MVYKPFPWRRYAGAAMGFAARQAFNYGKRKISEAVDTEVKRRRYMKRGQTSSGVMAGKIKAKFRPARYVKRIRRYGRTKVVKRYSRTVPKMNFRGVCIQRETTNSLSDDKCVYLTHSTAVAYEHMNLLVQLWMKKVLIEYGLSIDDFADNRTAYISTGVDQFVLVFKPDSNTAPTGINYFPALADATYAAMATAFTNLVITGIQSGLKDTSILVEFQFVRNGQIYRINLLDNKLSLFCKATLKMQNRSVAASGDDEMDVNNVPITGKIYRGMGNGACYRGRDNTFFYCNEVSGVSPYSAGTSTSLQEPPDASEFTNVKGYSKLYLNPGGIRTSVLTFKSNIQLLNLWKKLVNFIGNGVNTGSTTPYDLGRFNIISLERVIGKLAAEASPGINVTYEHDLKTWLDMRSVQQSTTPLKIVT